MSDKPSAVEMYKELIQLGYVRPSDVQPSGLMMPTAYITVPTSTTYFTPPLPKAEGQEKADAKLGIRIKRNFKRKRRTRR